MDKRNFPAGRRDVMVHNNNNDDDDDVVVRVFVLVGLLLLL